MPDDIIHLLLVKISELSGKLDATQATVGKLEVHVAELRTRMELRPECPSPGECIRLRDDQAGLREEVDASLAAMRGDVETHKQLISELKGGWKALVIICSVCSTLGGIAGWVFAQLSK